AVRIAASGLLGRWFGPEASEGFYHLFTGWVLFVVAFAVLLLEASLLLRRHSAPRRAAIG
ncbi:MAG: archaeosortase/exosortase family protein, partial [Terriglobales bacterium]